MKRTRIGLLAVALALMVPGGVWAQPAGAQPAEGPPARIGNVWDGVRHQPTREAVRSDGEDAQRKAAEDRELAVIQKQLLSPQAH